MDTKDDNKRKGEIAEVPESRRRGGGETEMERKIRAFDKMGQSSNHSVLQCVQEHATI